MATRQFDFIQAIETGSAPTPATPSADGDTISKGYADATYAKRSSFYDKQANNAGIKAISSADRSNGQIVFNYGTAAFWRFDSGSALADDGATVLQPDSGTGRWLVISSGGSASGDSLVQEFDTKVTTFKSAESLSNRDACCIEIHNGSGSNEYKIFKADNDVITRRSFAGFTKAAVTGTANVKTYTISAAYVSGNVVPININGRSYSVNFTTSSDNTLKLLRDAIAVDQDVASAVVTVIGGNQTGSDDREIVITGSNGQNTQAGYVQLNITGTTVTGGASQPTVTVPENTAAVQNAVDLHILGPLDGFTSLTVGDDYFLSNTAGAITNGIADPAAIYVGRALSSTVLFVNPVVMSRAWGNSKAFVRSHGSTDATAGNSQTNSEHYNGTSWSAGTSASTAKWGMAGSNSAYGGFHYAVGGIDSSGTTVATGEKYNKVSWSSTGSLSTAKRYFGNYAFNNYFYAMCGSNSGGSYLVTSEKYNGTSWSAVTGDYSTAVEYDGAYADSSLLYKIGGYNGADITTVETRNTSDTVGSGTAIPAGGNVSASTAGPTANTGVVHRGTVAGSFVDSTTMYLFSGGSWSTLTSSYGINPYYWKAFALSASGFAIANGGRTNAGTTVTTAESFNGATFASITSSSTGRVRAIGSGI